MGRKHAQHADSAVRQSQIIDAALECFAEVGFVETTMEDIRTRSGASNGSIYHHFKSKDQLAAAVYIEGIKNYQAGLTAALTDLPAREGIYEIVRYHLEWVAGNRLWSRYLFAMRHADFMKMSEDSISQHNAAFNDKLSVWFRKQVTDGKLRRLPRELYISLIWGPCQEYAKHWLACNGSPDQLEFAAGEIGKAAWRALRETEKTR